MKIFDIAIDINNREKFINYLKLMDDSRHNNESAIDYYQSDQCTAALIKLRKGETNHTIPKKIITTTYGNKKSRVIYKWAEEDNMLMRLIAYSMHYYDSQLSNSLITWKLGSYDGASVLRKINNIESMYFTKFDIANYGHSIDAEILKQKISQFFTGDNEIIDYLNRFIDDRRYSYQGKVYLDRPASPCGSPLAMFFTILYLNDLDKILEKTADIYLRACDDILIGTYHAAKQNELYNKIIAQLSELKLTINEKKTGMYEPGCKITYMRLDINGANIDICYKLLKKIKKNLAVWFSDFERSARKLDFSPEVRGLICINILNNSDLLKLVKNFYTSINTDKSLKELDHYIQSGLRRIISGKKGKKIYNCSYKQLQDMGYRSLVGQFYKSIMHVK